jgi:hypothetical protein
MAEYRRLPQNFSFGAVLFDLVFYFARNSPLAERYSDV